MNTNFTLDLHGYFENHSLVTSSNRLPLTQRLEEWHLKFISCDLVVNFVFNSWQTLIFCFQVLFYALALTSLATVDSSFIPSPAIAAPAVPAYVNTAPPNVPPFSYSVNVVNTGLRAPFFVPPYVPGFPTYPTYTTPFTYPLRAPYPTYPYTPFPYFPQPFFYRRWE